MPAQECRRIRFCGPDVWTTRLNERSTLNVRYAFQDANQFATVTQPYSAELDQPFNIRNQNITLNLTRFLSGNFFTESRAVFSRLFQESPAAPVGRVPIIHDYGRYHQRFHRLALAALGEKRLWRVAEYLSAIPGRQLDSRNSQPEIWMAVPALAR